MRNFLIILLLFTLFSCRNNTNSDIIINCPDNIAKPKGMIWVPGNTFTMGAKDGDFLALPHEKPAHSVAVDGFFMDETEVTNAQFRKFIDATGYVTTAEIPIDWEKMKKTLPEGTLKPHDSILAPGSLVFHEAIKSVNNLNNWQQWWKWTLGANWRHPYGPKSNIIGKDNFPVVHITYKDALAYCKWANRKLPTEAQWELAAMGSLKNSIYTWGNEKGKIDKNANTWQGSFPIQNSKKDGFILISPVKSFPTNSIGLYELAGNVWEYTADWYNVDYYQELIKNGTVTKNPKGAAFSKNPDNPYQPERIIKGGSFLCNENYCSSFRISARMGMTEDSSSDHVGFRTIATINMLK